MTIDEINGLLTVFLCNFFNSFCSKLLFIYYIAQKFLNIKLSRKLKKLLIQSHLRNK